MKAALVRQAGADYGLVERDEPEPGLGQVKIRVHACGFCHSDENIRNGWIGNAFPRVPGHEVAGVIETVGDGVPERWQVGDRVGVGWHGGHCGACDACRAGDFLRCGGRQGCGSSYDGGFQEAMVAPFSALVRIPEGIPLEEAAPVMCGGITVWNALRRSGASWGDTVAVQGLGGLGHFAIQYADKMGFRTVAVSRGADKEGIAFELGADEYIDAAATDPGKALQAMGGAKAVITTVPSGKAMQPLVGGLGPDGRMVIVGVSPERLEVPAAEFLGNDKGIQGSTIGTPRDIEDCLAFGALKDVRPWIETFSLEDIHEAVRRLHAGELRFRGVLTMSGLQRAREGNQ